MHCDINIREVNTTEYKLYIALQVHTRVNHGDHVFTKNSGGMQAQTLGLHSGGMAVVLGEYFSTANSITSQKEIMSKARKVTAFSLQL